MTAGIHDSRCEDGFAGAAEHPSANVSEGRDPAAVRMPLMSSAERQALLLRTRQIPMCPKAAADTVRMGGAGIEPATPGL